MKKGISCFLFLVAIGIAAFLYFRNKPADPDSTQPGGYLENKAAILKQENNNEANKHSFCGNNYFPLVPGASWTYRMTNRDLIESLEIEVPEPVNGLIVFDARLGSTKWTFRHEFSCEGGHIIVSHLNFLDLPGHADTYATKVSQEGFLMPSSFGNLTSWYFNVVTKNEVLDIPTDTIKRTYEESYKITFQRIGTEQIESGIGKFQAEHIKASGTVERKNAGDGNGETKQIRWEFWLADQAGMVKSEYEEEGKAVTTLELNGLQIPAKK